MFPREAREETIGRFSLGASVIACLSVVLPWIEADAAAMVGQFLQGREIYIHGPRGMRTHLLGQIISEGGGILAEEPSKNVTRVLCDEAMTLSDLPRDLVKSCSSDCQVVKVEWLCHSARDKKELPTAGYALADQPEPPVVEKKPRGLEKETSTVEKQKSGVKRLREECPAGTGNTAEGVPAAKKTTDVASILCDTKGGDTAVAAQPKQQLASIFVRKAATAEQRYWKHEPPPAGTLIREGEDFVPRKKVAAFDLDSTLIVTKSGNQFPSNENDWKLIQETVLKRKLGSLINDGYCIVVISNQVSLLTKKVGFLLHEPAPCATFPRPSIVLIPHALD